MHNQSRLNGTWRKFLKNDGDAVASVSANVIGPVSVWNSTFARLLRPDSIIPSSRLCRSLHPSTIRASFSDWICRDFYSLFQQESNFSQHPPSRTSMQQCGISTGGLLTSQSDPTRYYCKNPASLHQVRVIHSTSKFRSTVLTGIFLTNDS